MTDFYLWYPPAERISYVILDWDGNVEEIGPVLTDADVVCDICNAEISLRPVPVWNGNALCDDCLGKFVPDWYQRVSVMSDGEKILEDWYEQRRARWASE
jgi:hypothetical protein